MVSYFLLSNIVIIRIYILKLMFSLFGYCLGDRHTKALGYIYPEFLKSKKWLGSWFWRWRSLTFCNGSETPFIYLKLDVYVYYILLICTDCVCLLRLLFCLAWKPHSMHRYFLPMCTDCKCLVRLPFCVAW